MFTFVMSASQSAKSTSFAYQPPGSPRSPVEDTPSPFSAPVYLPATAGDRSRLDADLVQADRQAGPGPTVCWPVPWNAVVERLVDPRQVRDAERRRVVVARLERQVLRDRVGMDVEPVHQRRRRGRSGGTTGRGTSASRRGSSRAGSSRPSAPGCRAARGRGPRRRSPGRRPSARRSPRPENAPQRAAETFCPPAYCGLAKRLVLHSFMTTYSRTSGYVCARRRQPGRELAAAFAAVGRARAGVPRVDVEGRR